MGTKGTGAKGYWGGLPYRGSALIMLTVKQILLNKYLPVAFAFLLIPSAIAVYTLFDTPKHYDPVEMFTNISLFLFLQFFVLLYTLIYGCSLLQDEIEKRTITYLIVRQSKRFEVVLFKYIGLIISLNVLFFFAIAISYCLFMIKSETGEFLDNLDKFFYVFLVMFFGTLGYGAFFTFLSARFSRPLMIGLLYAFIWEVFITNIPANIRRATLMYYLRSVFYHKVAYGQILDLHKMESMNFSVFVIIAVMLFFVLWSCRLITKREMH